jgi:excinuclease ABC subunit C
MPTFDHRTFLKNLTTRPGVYRMFGDSGEILYVGKAKNLRNRVSSYFRSAALDPKTMALVAKIYTMEVTVTNSETEALLLEQSLIKELKPPYNIDFKDDKSYPYIFLSDKDKYPRLSFHRGAKRKKGQYFGPFPSAYSVRDSLNILQKVFRIRQCEDSFFKNRSRPCLQYQIKRCSGPCCELVTEKDYAEDVADASKFLAGKNRMLIDDLANKMEVSSLDLQFERAAIYRDQITHLQKIQEQQYVTGGHGDLDIIGGVLKPGAVCVLVMFVRGGRLLGNKTYFPKIKMERNESELLTSFIPQYYLNGFGGREIPQEIITSAVIEEKALIAETLSKKAERKVLISDHVRGHRQRWVSLAITNAEQSLGTHLSSKNNIQQRFESLRKALSLETTPERLECFDISHSSGEATVASCVVFDKDGPLKSDYRRFNIEGITGGDDYAAMSQALSRRYTRLKKGESRLPDILFVDGGKGQLHEAERIMEELQIQEVMLVGVAKGPSRKAGLESLFVAFPNAALHQSNRYQEIELAPDDPGLHLIQHIRDESHRFAITAHRQRRGKARQRSGLEDIEGVGPKRRRALLRHFGGANRVESASEEELAKVEGISTTLANHIYATLHAS